MVLFFYGFYSWELVKPDLFSLQFMFPQFFHEQGFQLIEGLLRHCFKGLRLEIYKSILYPNLQFKLFFLE